MKVMETKIFCNASFFLFVSFLFVLSRSSTSASAFHRPRSDAVSNEWWTTPFPGTGLRSAYRGKCRLRKIEDCGVDDASSRPDHRARPAYGSEVMSACTFVLESLALARGLPSIIISAMFRPRSWWRRTVWEL